MYAKHSLLSRVTKQQSQVVVLASAVGLAVSLLGAFGNQGADSGRNTDLHYCCAEEELAAAAASGAALKVRTLSVPVLYGRCTACSSLPHVRWRQPCHSVGPSGPCMPCMSEYPPEWPPLEAGTQPEHLAGIRCHACSPGMMWMCCVAGSASAGEAVAGGEGG